MGVVVLKDGKILLGKRVGEHAAGVYGAPGGHVEAFESFETCAIRETREEAGVEIANVRFLCLTNLITEDNRHYVNIGMVADWQSGEPEAREPEKMQDWQWYPLDQLPEPGFGILYTYIRALKTGETYFDLPVQK